MESVPLKSDFCHDCSGPLDRSNRYVFLPAGGRVYEYRCHPCWLLDWIASIERNMLDLAQHNVNGCNDNAIDYLSAKLVEMRQQLTEITVAKNYGYEV